MRRLLELIFAGRVPLAFQNPYPIIVYSVAKYRPHLSHFFFSLKHFLRFNPIIVNPVVKMRPHPSHPQ